MNIWIKRSLSATAVAGGIVFFGAVAAQADDGSSTHEQESSGSLSSPLEIGGLSLGAESTQSSTASSTTSHTDADGTHTSTTTDESSSTKGAGLQLDPTRIDPQAAFGQQGSSSAERDGDDRAQQQESATEAEASAPIEVGGLSLHGASASEDASSDASTSTDEDGTHRSESTRSSGSESEASLGTGSLSLDPRAGFADQRATSSTDAGHAGHDDTTGASSSATSAWAASPIQFDGAWADASTSSWSEETHASTSTDEDGTRTTEGSRSEESSSEAGLALGELTAAPGAAFDDARQRDDERDGDDTTSSSTSSTDGTLAAPFTFEGLAGHAVTERSTSGEDVVATTDEDGATTDRSSYATSDAYGVHGASGEATADPALGLATDQASTRDDEERGDDARTSDSSTVLHGSSPFAYEGFVAGALAQTSDARAHERTQRDEDETHTERHESTDASSYAPAFGFDGFSGDPAGSFELEKAFEELTQQHRS